MNIQKIISNDDIDVKRENANINADAPMGMMLKIGSETVKDFCLNSGFIPERFANEHKSGYIHIHDLDFYPITFNCCQINLNKLLKEGFSTGTGYIRPPKSINTAAALTCIAIQSNQNDMYGGQGIPTFEYDLAPFVSKSFIKHIIDEFSFNEVILNEDELNDIYINSNENEHKRSIISEHSINKILELCDMDVIFSHKLVDKCLKMTEKDTYQAMESLIHNLNTLASRSGAQVPFSSLNYGTGTTPEQRMIIKNILLATKAGIGYSSTAIFPIQVFKVKNGVNANQVDPNYDLFELACEVSALRLFPNFLFLDSPYNNQYYNGSPESEVATMGCRTRVIGNIDKSKEISTGRGNISFTTINLPRLAIESKKSIDTFFEKLDHYLELIKEQLLLRFDIIANKKVYNFPFLMGQGVWIDSKKLNPNDSIREVLKHGSMSIGFVGLAETLVALIGEHHGQSETARDLGIKIISHIRKFTDNLSELLKLNFSTFATPAESLSGRFLKLDREKYGIIPGVTDKEYYTNSFHVPVNFNIQISKKVEIEAPYHDLCNAGSISYIELDGNFCRNIAAFKTIVNYAKTKNLNYFSINHPVDRCPVCNFVGVINDVCPKCGRKDGEAVDIEKLKQIGELK